MAVQWWEYLIPIVFIPLAYLLSHLGIYLLVKLEKLTAKTKSTLDDKVIANLKTPVRVIFVFLGVYFAVGHVLYKLHPEVGQGLVYGITLFDLANRLFVLIGMFIAAYTATKVVKGVFEWYLSDMLKGEQKKKQTIFKFSQNIIFALIYVFALLIALSSLNIDITPMIAGLGIGGLAVALAAQDTLSNFLSGAYLSADQPIRVGDFIELSDKEKGHVEEISWRSTKIKTLDNNIMIIPNAKLANSVITNYEKPKPELVFLVHAGVSYESDLDKVEKVTLTVAKDVMKNVVGGVPEFEPSVRYKEFADSSVNFTVSLASKEMKDKFLVTHEFIKRLKKAYDKEKIEIPFPQRDVHMKKA